MPRRRKIIWLGSILSFLLVLAGGIGGYYWYRNATAVDRKVRQLVYEAAGYPDSGTEKFLKEWKLDFLLHEKPKMREWSVVGKELLAIGPAATPELILLLDDDIPHVRYYAISILGELGDTRAVKPLIRSLRNDESSGVRRHVVACLRKFNDKRTVEPLIEALQKDVNSGVRINAAFTLGKIGDKRAVEPLMEALRKDPDAAIRDMAAIALGELGDKRALEPLLKILDTNRPGFDFRNEAAEVLGKLGDPQALNTLEEALQKETDSERQSRIKGVIAKLKSAAARPGADSTPATAAAE